MTTRTTTEVVEEATMVAIKVAMETTMGTVAATTITTNSPATIISNRTTIRTTTMRKITQQLIVCSITLEDNLDLEEGRGFNPLSKVVVTAAQEVARVETLTQVALSISTWLMAITTTTIKAGTVKRRRAIQSWR